MPGGTASHTAQASLGAGEGEVDLVIWTGYAERGDNDPNYDWVTPFESKTGCKVKTQDGTDSANMVQLMQGGGYDGVSASGDATKRLIAAGLVSPINPALIPNYANIFDSLKLKDYNSVNGVPYGVPHGRGAEPPPLQHRYLHHCPHELGRRLQGGLPGGGQDQHLQLGDLHRRRRDVPQGAQPGPEDHEPL